MVRVRSMWRRSAHMPPVTDRPRASTGRSGVVPGVGTTAPTMVALPVSMIILPGDSTATTRGRASLDRSARQAGYVVALQQDIDEHARDDGDDHAGLEHPPVDAAVPTQLIADGGEH